MHKHICNNRFHWLKMSATCERIKGLIIMFFVFIHLHFIKGFIKERKLGWNELIQKLILTSGLYPR